MNCKLFQEKINDYINNQLPKNELLEMEIHTEKCEHCREMLREEIKIDNLFKSALKNNEVEFNSQKSIIMHTIDVNKYKTSNNNKSKDKKSYFKRGALVAAAFVFIFILNKDRLSFRMGNRYEMSLDDSAMEKATREITMENEENIAESSKNDMVEEAKVMNSIESDESLYYEQQGIYVTYMNKEQFYAIIQEQKLITEFDDKIKSLANLEYKVEIIEGKGIFIQSMNEQNFQVLNISFKQENMKAYDVVFYMNKLLIIIGDKDKKGGDKIYSYDLINRQLNLEYEEKNDNTLIVNFEKGNNGSIIVVKKKTGSNTDIYDYVREILELGLD